MYCQFYGWIQVHYTKLIQSSGIVIGSYTIQVWITGTDFTSQIFLLKMFINGYWLSTLKLWQAYPHWNEFNTPHSARTPRNEYYSKPYRENSYTPRGDVDIWESESVRHWIGAFKYTHNHMTWSHDLVLKAGCFCCVIHQTHCFVLNLEFCWILFSHWLIWNLKWLHAFKRNQKDRLHKLQLL